MPGKGTWVLDDETNSILEDVFLIAPDIIMKRGLGVNELRRLQELGRRNESSHLSQIYYALERYARNHNGMTPKSFDQLKNRGYLDQHIAKVFLVPPVKILEKNKKNQWQRTTENNPLLLHTKPVIDDGKHWVMYSDGKSELVHIDKELIKKYGVSITAKEKPIDVQIAEVSVNAKYKIMGRLKKTLPKSHTTLSLKNVETGDKLKIDWSPVVQKQQSQELMELWAINRQLKWLKMLEYGYTGHLPYWYRATINQYNLTDSKFQSQSNFTQLRRGRGTIQPNLFSVLGGSAAIQETLQLQTIGRQGDDPEAVNIPIASIKGVEVKSHPFQRMLGDNKGGSLELANVVPDDRFFAWFSSPKYFLEYLGSGSDFIFDASSLLSPNINDHEVRKYYLDKIGIDYKWTKLFFESNAIGEMSVILPDLFLVDGTDVTLALELKNPAAAKAMLHLAGIKVQGEMVTYTHKNGESYWDIQSNLLLISTNAGELKRVKALVTGKANNSLGQSAEFKYMLTQLPIEEKTRSFFYFSDPFIRRLVGPEVKIGQMRRLRIRSEMTSIIAACLLYKADGNVGAPQMNELKQRGYLFTPVSLEDITLNKDCSVSSASLGTPSDIPTILDKPVLNVGRKEQSAYQRYVENYTRYWRQYFDPIAIRLNQDSDKIIEVSTFILPLIDNSIYQGLKEFLVDNKSDSKLPAPTLTPEPIAILSVNLKNKLWDDGRRDYFRKFFIEYVGIPSRIVDYFGTDAHLAMGDGNPIITIGSDNLASASGMILDLNRGRTSIVTTISFIGSLLTRPVALVVGLNDPEAVKNLLASAPTGGASNNFMFGRSKGGVFKVAGKDAWRYHLNIEGLISMRFGIDVKDRFLIISNQPSSFNPDLQYTKNAENNGAALSLSPVAAEKQKSALYASARDQMRKKAMAGINILYPYIASGITSVSKAMDQMQAQLGFKPVHPGIGRWQLKNGVITSNVFGHHLKQMQGGDIDDAVPFGLLRGIDRVQLNMQFEDDGLRARAKWELH